MSHACNAYCTGLEHCLIAYSSREANLDDLLATMRAWAILHRPSIRFTRAAPASEAPPPSACGVRLFNTHGRPTTPDAEARGFLIWFEEVR